jgi:hypothetical protein
VRIDPDVAEVVKTEAKKNKRSSSREVTLSLACYYATRKPRKKTK